MHVLTRQTLIERLRATSAAAEALRQLPAWAFDQFYAEEEGKVAFEPGYRSVINSVLDDLMFGDETAFALTVDDVERLVHKLEHAQPADDDQLDDDEFDDA
jgi:hypothetical protein